MILPTKRLSVERALLSMGAEILRLLDEPKTRRRPLSYDWLTCSTFSTQLGPLTFRVEE